MMTMVVMMVMLVMRGGVYLATLLNANFVLALKLKR